MEFDYAIFNYRFLEFDYLIAAFLLEAAGRLPNPVALVRSTSFRSSSSSRFLPDDGYDSEDSGMISGSHYSTLEKLYAWEKKLYEEVKVYALIAWTTR